MYVSARSSSGPRISSASSFVLAPCVWILMKRHSGRPSTWMSARIQASMPDLGHTVAAQRGDKSADFVLGYRLYVVEVGRAVARHAFVDRQDDFRGDVTDRRRHRGDRHLTERVEDGVTSENDDRPPLVGCGEPVPADLASPHGSTQVCSRSQASNSPRPTGLRAYPSSDLTTGRLLSGAANRYQRTSPLLTVRPRSAHAPRHRTRRVQPACAHIRPAASAPGSEPERASTPPAAPRGQKPTGSCRAFARPGRPLSPALHPASFEPFS